MNISSWAIRRPIPAIVLFVVLTVLGLVSFQKMKIQNFPDIELPIVTVNVAWSGASPEQLETEVARKIEDSVANLPQLKHIYTTVQEGVSTTMVEFEIEKDTNEAMNDVRNAVDSIRSNLPTAVQEPTVSKVTLQGSPIATYMIESSGMDAVDLSWFVDNQVNKTLMRVSGVGQVARTGGVNREIRIELNTAQMQGLGITAADVSRALISVQQDAPGGQARIGQQEQSVRILATAQTVDDIRQLQIPTQAGQAVRLQDIAQVEDTIGQPSSLALVDGQERIVFDVTRSKGASEVTVLEDVRKAIATFSQAHPNVKITEIAESVKPIEDNYDDSISLLLEGAFLAIVVVWWFLRDWRATIISAVALPLSIIPTFWVMHLFGFTLNTVTLLSLSLVIGILVDDAIVEVENIVRHMNMGKTSYQAAMEGADEIGMAVIATSLTLVAVFLPTAFMGGVTGKFFVQFGWTAAVSVLFSLLVARLLTPMMAAYLLKPQSDHNHTDANWMTRYMSMVKKCLNHRRATVLASIAFFIVSMSLVGLLPKEFVPTGDLSRTAVNVELPPGYTLEQTRAVTERIRTQILAKNPDITRIYAAVGVGQTTNAFVQAGPGDARKATINLTLTDRSKRSKTQQEIETELREQLRAIPGARITVGSIDSSSKFETTLAGDNAQVLNTTARTVEQEMRTIPGIGSVTSSASLQRPEVTIRPDFGKMAQMGISTQALADTVRIATNGDYSQILSKLNLPERQVPIIVRLEDQQRMSLDSIRNLRIRGNQGLVPLGSIADVQLGTGATEISRFDRQRNVKFTIEPNGIPLGELEQSIKQLPTIKKLPAGVTHQDLGDAQAMAELVSGFSLAMLAGIASVYIVLILLFHDFGQPLTILAALPLAAGGAFGALFVTGFSLSMPAMIGLIMLIGIVTKNSILLVDYALMAYHSGVKRLDAVLDACHKRSRPIVMTTIAMGAGMLPNALGLGADPSFRAPMAVVVIGGLLTSTFLSLLVIPVIFTYVDDFGQWLKRKLGRPTANNNTHATTDSCNET